MLAELTHQVESSVKEVSSLHGRFSDTVIDSQKEREEVLRAKESQLKCEHIASRQSLSITRQIRAFDFCFTVDSYPHAGMEKRLVMQQNENDKEREHLHSLLAKFERHISEKSNELERVSTNYYIASMIHRSFSDRIAGSCSKTWDVLKHVRKHSTRIERFV